MSNVVSTRNRGATESNGSSLVDSVESPGRHPVAVRAARVGWAALIIGICGAAAWAAMAPLDEGVPAVGTVAIDTKRKPVQHISGGIVREVVVREGQDVKEGDLLIRLDDAVARANFETVRQRYLGLRITQGRLLAEQSGSNEINLHADARTALSDPLIAQQLRNQEQLMASRRALLKSDLQIIEESIAAQEALGTAYEAMLANRRNQLNLINEELGQTRGLVRDGYVPRNRQLELERNVAELNSSIADVIGNSTRVRSTIAELRQRAQSRREDHRREVQAQLTDVERDVLSEVERFKAVGEDLKRIDIRAPASGQVVGLAVQTVGGVVAAGQRLMDVVPAGERMLIETHVPPHLIDRVKPGMVVDVRFSSFAHSPQLVVDGKVMSVSTDLLADQLNPAGYYLSRVQITQKGLEQLGKRQLQSGMPVEVVFRTGERSLLTYMLHPLTKRLAAAMTEE